MIRTVEIGSWSEYQEQIHKQLIRDARDVHYQLYYRGQADSAWPLATTLERAARPSLSVGAYYRMIQAIRPALETFTGRKWDLPEVPMRDRVGMLSGLDPKVTEYMAYLRHYGFPSPFLDWSRSPFVAAYFAFREVSSQARSVAIYEFLEVGDESIGDQAEIMPVYATGQDNKRYYLQQSAHTVCLRADEGGFFFAPHESARSISGEIGGYLSKCVLPASERPEVLHSLQAYNINAFSLIGSEEGLLESLFLEKYLSACRAKSYYGNQMEEDGW